MHQKAARRLTLCTCVSAALVGSGCNIEPAGDPFDPDRNIKVQPSLMVAVVATAGVIGTGMNVLGIETGPTPRDYAKTLADPDAEPDMQRQAIDGLVKRRGGRTEAYTSLYAAIAGDDSENDLVRSSAVRALGKSEADDQAAQLVELLDDPSAWVRLEAAKALIYVPNRDAVPTLLARAGDEQEDQDVRIAAVAALRHYPMPEVVERLTASLEADPFALAFQARMSLVAIFGTDRGYEPDRWSDLPLSDEVAPS